MRTAEWTDSVSVLDRFTAVLDAFGDDDGLGVSEIARRANLPKSTVSRIVADLVRQRYLDREGSRLHLGLKLFELGQAVERPVRLRRLAHPIMNELRSLTGGSVRLAVLDGQHVVFIASLAGHLGPDRDTPTPTRLSAHTSALGRAILAHSAETQQLAATDAELLAVRRTGIAVQRDDPPGAVSVASAVCEPGSAPLGALAIVGHLEAVGLSRAGGLVRSAATALARRWAVQNRT